MDLVTLKMALKKAKEFTVEYVNNKIDAIRGGMRYIGSVDTADDLPTPSAEIHGHVYTALDTGHEHVCDSTRMIWVDLSEDLNRPLYPRGE